jgi:hypothetical protein
LSLRAERGISFCTPRTTHSERHDFNRPDCDHDYL